MRRGGLSSLALAMALSLAAGCARPQAASAPGRYGVVTFPVGSGTFLCSLAPSRAPAKAWPQDVPEAQGGGLFDLPFEGEGDFVEEPALCAAVFFGVIPGVPLGLVGVVVSLPFALFYGLDALWVGFYGPVIGCGAGGYYLVGEIMLGIRAVFWEAPCAFGRFLALAFRNPKGRVNFLVSRADHPKIGKAVRMELEEITWEGPKSPEEWRAWWGTHRDEFDKNMKRIKPPAPEPKPGAPRAPAPLPAPEAPAPAL